MCRARGIPGILRNHDPRSHRARCSCPRSWLAAGCSQYKALDTTAYLRQQYAKEVGAQEAGAGRGALRARRRDPRLAQADAAARQRAAAGQPGQRLHLRRPAAPVHRWRRPGTPIETYRTRSGNCLSFVNLFVGVAREPGLTPYYVEVTDLQKWNHRDGMVVSQGHIVAGMYLDGVLRTFDFLPYRQKAYKDFNPIDDLTAAAHYYNNLGAEALLAGDLERARGADRRPPPASPRASTRRSTTSGVIEARSRRAGEGARDLPAGARHQPRRLDPADQHGPRPPGARPRQGRRPRC